MDFNASGRMRGSLLTLADTSLFSIIATKESREDVLPLFDSDEYKGFSQQKMMSGTHCTSLNLTLDRLR